ncbi:hypothetical protein PHMEG_00037300 [Phytophthora megakarya]|uniref:DDE-1 domain-containing protein n=1 Tax=Phytophthora megakarya TaxID=4795 RepID=A0A225UK38_9STRA|nr:hypothetical protein PHMEG_00037300 [Phytophthora megakarya]
MEAHKIVLRTQSGKKSVSPEKQASIEREVAKHLDNLQRGVESDEYDEDTVETLTRRTLLSTSTTTRRRWVQERDVVSRGEGMTLMVRISGGVTGHIHPPTMIFQNAGRNYPIKGVPIIQLVFRIGYERGRHGREKRIFLDNCTSHLDQDQCENKLAILKARLVYFPANATDLCQPADSFVIAKIKDAWRRKWNERKIALIEGEE